VKEPDRRSPVEGCIVYTIKKNVRAIIDCTVPLAVITRARAADPPLPSEAAKWSSSVGRMRLSTLFLAGCVVSAASVAQTSVQIPSNDGPVDKQTGSASRDAPAKLEEIVVTAQKREQSAQDVGITLNVFSGSQLTERGVVSVPDIAKLTPGVSVGGSFAGQSVTLSIRGVTQQDFAVIAESPVAVYVDDGYLAANNSAGIGMLDVEQVEVLKGPQGTLFGRNATGGLVNITTRKPTDTVEVQSSVSYSSYNDVQAEVAAGGPLTDSVQGRIASMYQRNDGWVKNISPTGGDLGGQEMVALRGQIAVQPADAVNLLFTSYFSDIHQSWGPYLMLSSRSTATNGIPNSVLVNEPTLFGQPASNAKDLTVDANNAQSSGGLNRIGGGTVHATVKLDGAELTSISDYKVNDYTLRLDDDASAISFIDDNPTIGHVANFSQELRMFKKAGSASLTTGLYYLNIDGLGTVVQELYGLGGNQVSSHSSLKTNSYSAFAQGELEIAPKVTLISGFRGTRELKDYHYAAFSQPLDGGSIADGRTYEGQSDQWLYSWKAQVEYRPIRDILFFAGYDRGTKAGSFNVPSPGSAIPPDNEMYYKPEKLDSYELGVKTTLLDGMLTLNGSTFYYDYKDYQAFKFIDFSTVVTNNPATIKGTELDLTARPMNGLDFSFGASYLDALVKDVAVSNVLASAIESRRPPYQSKWQTVVSARYEFPLGGGTASIQGDSQYRSGYFFSLTNFGATSVVGYTLYNARASWRTPDDRWEFAVFGRNLADARYKTVGFEASDFGGFTQVAYGQPRWVGVSASYRIGK
jgi:iron complex outermembrane recepter protein